MEFKGFFSSVNELVSTLDNFAYIPTFNIKRERSYQSPFGGCVYLGYLLFFAAYSLYSLSIFIQQYNQINSVKENLTRSINRNFNSSDIQFGVGLLDQNYKNLNWNDFPQLEVQINSYEKGKKTTFNLSYCTEELMYSPEDWNKISLEDQIKIKNLFISNYVCTGDDFNITLNHRDLFIRNLSYFEIVDKIKNLSIVNSTIDLIQSKRLSIQLIWGSYIFMFNNFFSPILTFIDKTHSYLRTNIISNSEILIEPTILYDNQVFGNSLSPYKAEININQNDSIIHSWYRSKKG